MTFFSLRRVLLLAVIGGGLTVSCGAEDGLWRVDNYYLREPISEVKVKLEPDEYWDQLGYSEPERPFWSPHRVEATESLGVLACHGSTLTFNGKLLLKEGDSLDHVLEILGPPDRIGGMMGWCQEDPWVRWNYRRGGDYLSLTVSNDDFWDRHGCPESKDPTGVVRSRVFAISLVDKRAKDVLHIRRAARGVK